MHMLSRAIRTLMNGISYCMYKRVLIITRRWRWRWRRATRASTDGGVSGGRTRHSWPRPDIEIETSPTVDCMEPS